MDDLQHQPIEVPDDFQSDNDDRPSRSRRGNRGHSDKPKKSLAFQSRFVNFMALSTDKNSFDLDRDNGSYGRWLLFFLQRLRMLGICRSIKGYNDYL